MHHLPHVPAVKQGTLVLPHQAKLIRVKQTQKVVSINRVAYTQQYKVTEHIFFFHLKSHPLSLDYRCKSSFYLTITCLMKL